MSFPWVILADARFLIKIHCLIISLIHFRKKALSFRACFEIKQSHLFIVHLKYFIQTAETFSLTLGSCRVKNAIYCTRLQLVTLIRHSCLWQSAFNKIVVESVSVSFVCVSHVLKQFLTCLSLEHQWSCCVCVCVCVFVSIRTVTSGPSIQSLAIWQSEMLLKWALDVNYLNQGAECKEQSSAEREKLLEFLWQHT